MKPYGLEYRQNAGTHKGTRFAKTMTHIRFFAAEKARAAYVEKQREAGNGYGFREFTA